jgi:hypothetical protein
MQMMARHSTVTIRRALAAAFNHREFADHIPPSPASDPSEIRQLGKGKRAMRVRQKDALRRTAIG